MEEKEKKFELFKNNFDGMILEEKDLLLIKNIFINMDSKEFKINKLIQIYNDNRNEINALQNTIEMYNTRINNYNFEYAEEFSIEKMITLYKSQFDKNSSIYINLQERIGEHYRFNSSYNKIISTIDMYNFNFNDIKNTIKKISGNALLDLLSKIRGNSVINYL